MVTVRRLIAILLLLVFGSAGAAPLFASASDPAARLPICCRQGGVHHCSMGLAVDGQAAFRASCPAGPRLVSPLPNQSHWHQTRFLSGVPGVVWPRLTDPTHDEPRGPEIAARVSRGPPQA